MIKIEHTDVFGWDAAIRGARNPMNSWDKMDSGLTVMNPTDVEFGYEPNSEYIVGPNDLKLLKNLSKAGSDHGKFLRMINVTADITAPLYWWKEFDTYKVGTVANSCSTMHKIHAKEFTLEDFSREHLCSGWSGKDKNGEFIILPGPIECLENTVIMLNRVRDSYLEACKKGCSSTGLSAKDIWWQMIQLLPSSYNQKRTVQLNYQVLKTMYRARHNHKLDEWHTLCEWMENLPYFKEICLGIGDFDE